jgi:thiol-disulfide isomerase/thioredoxin
MMLILTACAQAVSPTVVSENPSAGQAPPTATVDVAPTPTLTDEPTPTDAPAPTPIPTAPPTLLPAEKAPRGAEAQFRKTDFNLHSVPYDEILSGGPPRDGIPPVDKPKYVTIADADAWLKPQEPVVLIEIDGVARAYPLQILMWHEITNAVQAGIPVAVTFCPLCNTAIAFDRRVDDQVFDFGTTGRLRYSNLIMYDRQTETWWQQATGEGIVGQHTGRKLTNIPAAIISWQDFRETYPDGDVLSQDTGHVRSYGRNPYAGYDDINRSPFLYDGPKTSTLLPPMARVATVELNDETVAYPYSDLENVHVVNDAVGGTPIVVLWQAGTASALDSASISEGRDVGAVNTFSRELDGRTLTFLYDGERFTDEETGSEWTVLGQAIDGPLAGRQLEPVVHINHFWFSWAAFRPETRVYRAEGAKAPAPTSAPETANVAVDLDFVVSLYQGEEELGGQVVRFSRVFEQGKPVVLVMWAGLCPICRVDLPLMQEAYRKYGDDVVFLGVDIGPYTGLGFEAEGRALLTELGITFPAGSTEESAILQEYRIFGVPETLLFAPDGEVSDRWSGLVHEKQLKKAVDALLEA